MIKQNTIYKPHWETVEHGWHAVVSLCNQGYRWTAFIEFAEAPVWRIWAGCMFSTVQEAQEWCRTEIANQMHRNLSPQSGIASYDNHEQTDAWQWLWTTLSQELGVDQAEAVRQEMLRRVQAGRLTDQAVGVHATG
jgi:hypothetical protein